MPSIKKPSDSKAVAAPKSKLGGINSEKTKQSKPVGRIRIRFGESRKASPIGYLSLDDALNLLGEKEYPDEWGAHQIWEEHPFRYKPKDRIAVRYSLEQSETGDFKRYFSRIDRAFTRSQLRAAHQIYRSVWMGLKSALELGEVMSAKFFKDGTIQAIRPRDGIWAAQMNSIFYTGYAHEQRDSKPTKFRILVDKVSFERLLSPPQQAQFPKSKKVHVQRFLELLVPKLSYRANTVGYRFKKDPLRRLASEVFKENGLHLGGPTFEGHLWSKVRGEADKPGRRNGEESRSFEQDNAELKNIIRNCYREFTFPEVS